VNSVLLVRLSAMGDLVQSLGSVQSLRAARPDARITVVTQQPWAPLLEHVDGIDKVVRFDRRGGLSALWQVRRELRQERFDVAIDLQGNWKSALITRLARATTRIGMTAEWRQEPRSKLLLQRTVACAATPHPARAAWELVKQVAPEAAFCHPQLTATEAELADERVVLKTLGIDCDAPFRVIVVTDPADPRALRPTAVDAFAEGMPTVLLLGPGEQGLQQANGIVLRHQRGEVRRMIALGALVAAVGGEVLGPDQGATHVLLAAGARGRVFFGSQDPRRTSPPSAQPFVAAGELACRPCRARQCSHPDGVVCMALAPDSAQAIDAGLPPAGAVGAGPW